MFLKIRSQKTGMPFCSAASPEKKQMAATVNKKHLKNVGPIRHCEPFYIAIHQMSLHAACALMSTTTMTTTTRDRRDRYGRMEWAQQMPGVYLLVLYSQHPGTLQYRGGG